MQPAQHTDPVVVLWAVAHLCSTVNHTHLAAPAHASHLLSCPASQLCMCQGSICTCLHKATYLPKHWLKADTIHRKALSPLQALLQALGMRCAS